MKCTVTVKREVEVKYLSLDVAVRYDEEDMPNDAPLRDGDSWRAVIDLETATIENWPQGKSLSFKDMKICDEGIYKLLDADRDVVVEKDGYVPNRLLPGDYGDYLSLDIDETGKITNWKKSPDLSDFEESDD